MNSGSQLPGSGKSTIAGKLSRRLLLPPHPRHPVHGALTTDEEWKHRRRTAEPTGRGPALRVETSGPGSGRGRHRVDRPTFAMNRRTCARERSPFGDCARNHANCGARPSMPRTGSI